MLNDEKRTFRNTFQGGVNAPHEDIVSNIRQNIRRQLPQVQPYPPNKYKVALLLGGPSLAKAKIPKGYRIATVNGTHDWALERGLRPSVHMMLDARPFNARFVEHPQDYCRYLINAQCDPSVFDALEGYDVHIWNGVGHGSGRQKERKLLERYYQGRWQTILGGSSIGTRAIGLLYTVGIRHLKIFGMDGCLKREKHHAYDQPENDAGHIFTVKVGRRKFRTHTWMASQLDDFLQIAPIIPEDLKFSIEGDGLLAYIVNETTKRGRLPRITME